MFDYKKLNHKIFSLYSKVMEHIRFMENMSQIHHCLQNQILDIDTIHFILYIMEYYKFPECSLF